MGCQLFGHPSHATVNVAHSRPEKKIQNAGENRRPNVAMVPRHGPLLDLSLKPIAINKLVTLTPLLNEPANLAEVMATVGVTQNDEFASRFLDSLTQRAAIALDRNIHNSCATLFRELDG